MKDTKKIKLTILLLSLVQMATNGLAPMLAGVMQSFPEESTVKVQYLMTIPGIFVVVFSLVSAWLSTKIEKRFLVSLGAFFVALSGILAFFIHGNLMILWCWSGVLGTGMGLVCSLAASMIPDYLEGRDQVKYMGAQTSFGNLGAIIMTLLGGVLAGIAWHYNYLVFLIAIPGLVCGLTCLPKNPIPKEIEQEKEKVNFARPLLFVVIACLFLMCFNAVPTNLSRVIADTKQVGVLTALLLLGGILCGFVFHFIEAKIHIYTIPAGYALLGLGILGIAFSKNFLVIALCCLFAGSAIGLVMPQCMTMAAKKATNKTENATFLAMVMAGSNLGTFLTPELTVLNKVVFGTESVMNCFVLAAIILFVLMVLWTILFSLRKKVS